MTEEELIVRLSDRLSADFAREAARKVCEAEAVGVLYELVTREAEPLPKPLRHTLLFRGAYVLETIYFADRTAFFPYVEDFCRRGFPACSDASARRHLGKIMADLLERVHPDPQTLERIAATAADWVVDPAAKVAVRVWAMEVLKRCRGRIGWVDESWSDLVEMLTVGASPGIESRIRRSWR